MSDYVTAMLAIQNEYERAEAADDNFNDNNWRCAAFGCCEEGIC